MLMQKRKISWGINHHRNVSYTFAPFVNNTKEGTFAESGEVLVKP